MSQDPFSSSASGPGQSATAFFEDADLRQRLNLLRHLIQSTDMIVLVLGEAGLGKSTWLAQLAGSPESRWQFCALRAEEQVGAATLLGNLARCCDLPSDCGRPALDYLLVDHAAALARSARIPVAALDDAQDASPEALRAVLMLAVPHADEAAAWRVVLFGEPALEDQVTQLGLPAELHERLYTLTIPALSREQSEGYLALALTGAGGDGQTSWSAAELDQARGVPAALNALLARATGAPPAAAPAAGPVRRARPGRWTVAAITVAVLALAGVLLFQDAINQRVGGGSTPAEEIALPAHDQWSPNSAPARDAPDATQAGSLAPEPPAGDIAPHEVPPDSGAAVAQQAPAAERAASAPDSGAKTARPAPEPSTPAPPPPAGEDPMPPRSQPLPEIESTAEAASAGETSAPGASAPGASDPGASEPEAAEPGASARGASPSGASAPEASLPNAPTADANSVPSSADAAAGNAPEARGRTWLLARAPERYTLQVLGSRIADAAHRAIRDHGLEEAALYTVRYQGRDYHVLVQGDYPNREAARSAIADLPAALRRGGPWPRRFADVQQEVRSGVK